MKINFIIFESNLILNNKKQEKLTNSSYVQKDTTSYYNALSNISKALISFSGRKPSISKKRTARIYNSTS